MIRRFQLEDLITQDLSGVVFRALDSETGKTVAVHRFFPFGANGGGLNADEQSAYLIAVDRLVEVSHPALRAVIGGGCDPIDGIPYLATEWLEGTSLQTFLEQGPLPADIATGLIAQALEVCELLSHMLAKEAVWVETDIHTIIAGNEPSGRGFTFWISPLQWLGGHEQSRGLTPIVTLTEEIMGWHGRPVHDQAGAGLGGWLKWLRQAAATTSLHEAREALAASVGVEPPTPAKVLATKAARSRTKAKKRHIPWIPWVINLSMALVAAGLGAWYVNRQRIQEGAPLQLPFGILASAPSDLPELEDPTPTEPAAQPPPVAPVAPATPGTLAAPPAAALPQGGVIPWNNHDLLTQHANQEVVVEGVFKDIGWSAKRRTFYLLFSKPPAKTDFRGWINLKAAPADLTPAALTPLIGKKIRLHGTLVMQSVFKLQRPGIHIKDRASIKFE